MTESTGPLAMVPYSAPLVASRPARRRATAETCAMVVALAAMSSTLVLPLGMLGVIACACMVALAGIGVGVAPLRAALAALAVRRARDDRRDARERMLVAASSGYLTLVELDENTEAHRQLAVELHGS